MNTTSIRCKPFLGSAFLLLCSLMFSQHALAAASIGNMAPDFTLTDSDGKIHQLNQYRGKRVVLEWTNHGCPYVQKHYDSNNMQALQKEMTNKDVIWLSIISSKPGAQGYVKGNEANELTSSRKAPPTAVLLDPTGKVGRAYGAKTTPHMYVIDPVGRLVYMGAIDDKPSARASSLNGATNYVRSTMADMDAGRPVKLAQTTAYGCSIKY